MRQRVTTRYSAAIACVCTLIAATPAWSATVDAATCAQPHVTTAIAAAAVGDTVQVPAGSCAWSGLQVNKAVHLQGAGVGQTNIDLTGANFIQKQRDGMVRVSNFSFSRPDSSTRTYGFFVDGSWRDAEPVVIVDNAFVMGSSGLFVLRVAGGVIIARNEFRGGWDASFIQPADALDTGGSWTSADTLGIRDATGKLNHYVEDNTFYGGTNQGIDCDGSTRCVYRHNTLTFSSFNSHGLATSPQGIRHFEVYNNVFKHDGSSVPIAAQNWAIWIRGGTGVIFGNQIDDLAGAYWGDKSEIRFSIRGAEDVRPQGTCADVNYPVPHQIGQNHDGTRYFTDPVYLWDNRGTVEIEAGWIWGNPCGLDFDDFFAGGRDIINSGVAKPGYVPYQYPHPLAADGSTSALPAPTNLRVLSSRP